MKGSESQLTDCHARRSIAVTIPHLWQNIVEPKARFVDLVRRIGAHWIARPVFPKFVQVLWKIDPPFVAGDASVVRVGDLGIDVH